MKLSLWCAAVFLVSATAQAAPKLSQADARKIALQKVPGTIVHEKLKHKKHQDLYYIEIKPKDAPPKSDALKKVEIDANTGQVAKIKDVKAKAKSDD